jgi:hypothetical protein
MKRKPKKENKAFDLALEIFGWLGAILVVTAYTLSSFSVLQPTSIIYQLMNLIGSVGILIVSAKKRNYQPVLTNIVWLTIALIGIISYIATKW